MTSLDAISSKILVTAFTSSEFPFLCRIIRDVPFGSCAHSESITVDEIFLALRSTETMIGPNPSSRDSSENGLAVTGSTKL